MSRYGLKSVEREERRRAALAARIAKEQAKQESLDAARATVEEFEARVAELKSVHRQQMEPPDWASFAASLPPCPPSVVNDEALAARTALLLLELFGAAGSGADRVTSAATRDAEELRRRQEQFRQEAAAQQQLKRIADAVIDGDAEGYREALRQNPSLAELSEQGARLEFVVHSSQLLECKLFAPPADSLPTTVFSLTPTGRLTSKEMPRAQFTTLYQDFLCSCVLRIGREAFATLPIGDLIVTVVAKAGLEANAHVLSVVLPRGQLLALDFDAVDPSEAVEQFRCRTDFKASRRSGSFSPIEPFREADVTPLTQHLSAAALLARAKVLRDELE